LDKGIPVEDALKYIRFAGRPTSKARLRSKKVKSHPSPFRKAQLHRSEYTKQFISWVLKLAGLDPEGYRFEPLLRRLPACLRSLHVDTEAGAIQRLEQQPELLPTAIDALLIGVTEFFRDPTVFETLRTEILPQLAACDRPLRVWSAGCSNGAELYSAAILLAQTGLLERSYLLGTDCRFDAIERARKATYDSSQLQNIKLPDQSIYFTRVGGHYRPIESLCTNIHWRVANLARGIEEGPWDLILWRNMAIYLTPEAAEPIWHGLVSALAPGGALIVGRAERPPAASSLINMCRCIYRSYSGDGQILELQSKRKVMEMSI
jgi:chemotaxis protein methyltransferase CheR